jgi:hypothetical protein
MNNEFIKNASDRLKAKYIYITDLSEEEQDKYKDKTITTYKDKIIISKKRDFTIRIIKDIFIKRADKRPNLIFEIQKKANITTSSIAKILLESNSYEMFKKNPKIFIEKTIESIREAMLEVHNITIN